MPRTPTETQAASRFRACCHRVSRDSSPERASSAITRPNRTILPVRPEVSFPTDDGGAPLLLLEKLRDQEIPDFLGGLPGLVSTLLINGVAGALANFIVQGLTEELRRKALLS